MTALVDRQRLARVCGLLGSDHDGEALVAARQAEKIRKKVGLTWEELLVPSIRQRAADPPPDDLTGSPLSGGPFSAPNHTERHRAGLWVGTAITEGTANFLMNRRMNKSQQMRWS